MEPIEIDLLVKNFFDENTFDTENEFHKLQTSLSTSLTDLEKQLKETESRLKFLEKKEDLSSKAEIVDSITCLFNNYANHTEALNKLYGEKLYVVQILTKNLQEFTKFDQNIKFYNDIIEVITRVSVENLPIMDVVKGSFENNLELFDAIVQLKPHFAKGSKISDEVLKLEKSIDDSVTRLLEEAITEADLYKLEEILSSNTTFVKEAYLKLVVKGTEVDAILNTLASTNFMKINDDLFSQVADAIDNFFSELIKLISVQMGKTGRINIEFPKEARATGRSSLVQKIKSKISKFFELVAGEKGKSEEVFVRIVVKLLDSAKKFLSQLKDATEDAEAIGNIEIQIVSLLKDNERNYQFSEKRLIEKLVKLDYNDKYKMVCGIEEELEINKFNQEAISDKESMVIELLENTNFVSLKRDCITTIARMEKMIEKKEDYEETVYEYFIVALKTIEDLFGIYFHVINIFLKAGNKLQNCLSNNTVKIMTQINYKMEDFSKCFLVDLSSFLQEKGFFNQVSSKVREILARLSNLLDESYSLIYSSALGGIRKVKSAVDIKKAYKGSKKGSPLKEIVYVVEPLLVNVELWDKNYKNKICHMVGGAIADSLSSLALQCKINKIGVEAMIQDYSFITETLGNYLPANYLEPIAKINKIVGFYKCNSEKEIEMEYSKMKTKDNYELVERVKRKWNKMFG